MAAIQGCAALYVPVQVHHGRSGSPHVGLRKFVDYHFPHLRYQNPEAQILATASQDTVPVVEVRLHSGEGSVTEVPGKRAEEVLQHVLEAAGMRDEDVQRALVASAAWREAAEEEKRQRLKRPKGRQRTKRTKPDGDYPSRLADDPTPPWLKEASPS